MKNVNTYISERAGEHKKNTLFLSNAIDSCHASVTARFPLDQHPWVEQAYATVPP